MVYIEIDGFYCKECNELHPALFWHELYDEYIKTKQAFILHIKQINERFGNSITDKEALELYQNYITTLGIEFCPEPQNCIICGKETHYRLTDTNKFVCSNECKATAK